MAPTIPPTSRSSPPSSSSRSSSSCSSSSSDSNPGPIVVSSDDDEAVSKSSSKGLRNQRWLLRDEVKILTALRKERATGRLPTPAELCRVLRDDADLKRENLTVSDLSKKMYNLRRKFSKAVSDGARPRGRRDKMLFELCKEVWPELLLPEGSTVLGTVDNDKGVV